LFSLQQITHIYILEDTVFIFKNSVTKIQSIQHIDKEAIEVALESRIVKIFRMYICA